MKKILLLIMIFSLFGLNANAIGFGVGKNFKGERPNLENEIITGNNGFAIGPDNNYIYLTFDCGYEAGYTLDILTTLRKNNVKATFFITGHYLNSSRDIVKKMIDDGHIIGNHTYSHKDFTASSESEIINDVKKLEDNFYKEFNINMSKYVRPPRGEYNEMSQRTLANNGYKSVFWSLAYVDWNKNVYNGNHYSYNKVINKIHNGAIILMHTVSKDNMVDLDDIIKELKNEGFVFKSIDEL